MVFVLVRPWDDFSHPKYPIEAGFSFCESGLHADQQKRASETKVNRTIISLNFLSLLSHRTKIFKGLLGVFCFRRHGILITFVG